MEQKAIPPTATTSYREVKIGKCLYRVTSVYLGEKDLGKTLEQLIIRKAMADIRAGVIDNSIHP